MEKAERTGSVRRRTEFILLFWLVLLFSGNARGMTAVNASDSQAEYGRRVAALSAPASADLIPKGGARTLVLLRTDGTEIDFSAAGAEICVAGPGHRFTLVFPDGGSAEKAVQLLRKNGHVRYAEKDGLVSACDTAETADLAFQSYGAGEMGFSPLISWAAKEGGRTSAAVIDSGIGRHELLDGRVVRGWDYVDNDGDPTNDESGHGTHVAGILADCTRGLDVSLYAIRILNAAGNGTTSNAANSVLEAADRGIPIINLSFVAGGESQALDDAVRSAAAAGCVVVVAAGNEGRDVSGLSPARLTGPGIIVVGAAARSGERAGYSNYGSSVDCYAYGSEISSCRPGGGYAVKSGTSQAAPHIAAACAILKLLYHEPPASLENRIRSMMSGTGAGIPRLESCVPAFIPCHLTDLTLGVGENLRLPLQARPVTSGQTITWSSADETVARVSGEGVLTAVSAGQTVLTRSCRNFDESAVRVTVTAESAGRMALPSSLIRIETEALAGTGGHYLLLESVPRGLEEAAGPGIVILCGEGSEAAGYAEENRLQYLCQDSPAGK